jgi:hypothetical protein
MACRARVRDTGLFRLRRSDEPESMGAYEVVLDRHFDLRHVAGYALTASTPFSVMGMFAYCTLQAGWIVFCMAAKVKGIPRLRRLDTAFV